MCRALLLFSKMTNKCTITINSQIITLLHVSTPSCQPQGAHDQYFAKLHKYLKSSCILSTCVTWRGTDYELPEEDRRVSKQAGV